jgi:hypothetical protein
VKNPRSRTGAPYPMTHEVPFGLLDLSNPQTVAWMESIIAAMALSAGVDPTSGRPRVQVTPPSSSPPRTALRVAAWAEWVRSSHWVGLTWLGVVRAAGLDGGLWRVPAIRRAHRVGRASGKWLPPHTVTCLHLPTAGPLSTVSPTISPTTVSPTVPPTTVTCLRLPRCWRTTRTRRCGRR